MLGGRPFPARLESRAMSRALPLLAPLLLLSALGLPAEDEPAIDFARDVRPLLSDKCFACHGPDEAARQAELRLDLAEEALRDRGGYAAVVPGAAARSELYLRISDPDDAMPPGDSGKSLSAAEIELLRRWIDQGATWEEHWAYRAPERPEPPAIEGDSWSRGAIDRFLLARMREAGLSPEPEASRETLARRLALDLTGLPPSLEKLDRFLADGAPDAYERYVDELLASPRYGEHMARAWLDAARYGDTHGLHLDNERRIWPYRDWVIRAFDENMPFDRFTVEQLAGDLLPDATTAQRVATGFNRCNPTSAEGGMIAEEYLAKYASERVVTTASVWLGTTMLCAQCHDHKFDPPRQQEFYELYAFFNSIAEEASDENGFSPAPVLAVPDDAQAAELARLTEAVGTKAAQLDAPLPEVDAAEAAWRESEEQRAAGRWHAPEIVGLEAPGGTLLRELGDGSVLAEGPIPDAEVYEIRLETELDSIRALRLEVLRHESLASGSVGRAPHGNIDLSDVDLSFAPRGLERFEDVPLTFATADYSQASYPIRAAIDDDARSGWAVDGREEDREAWFLPERPFGHAGGSIIRLRLHFESQHAQHEIGRFRVTLSDDATLAPAALGTWHVAGPFPIKNVESALATDSGPEAGVDLAATYDGGRVAWVERPDFVDGVVHALEGGIASSYLFRPIDVPSARRLTVGIGSDDSVQLWLNGALVHSHEVPRPAALDQDVVELDLAAGRNELLLEVVNHGGAFAFAFRRLDEEVGGTPVAIARALADPAADPSLLRSWFRRAHSAEWRALADELAALEAERTAFEASIPSTLVMQDLAEPRPARVLERGAYDRPGVEVQPDTPDCLPPLGVEGRRATRLDLAEWLVRPDHPLTARVTVNRYWQELFGAGLVKTTQDFGAQGEFPTHPELLDWLATEFVASGWDVKHMIRLMVTSAAYRQATRVAPEKRALDPDNRLLARGPRFRLDAERVRDSALFVSGLLVECVGGPSVKPYQPDGLWEAVAYTTSNTAHFVRDDGDALWRRSLYTFWKRTSPPPSMQLFDAPSRESCTLQRARTNTPLQALALLNDVQFVEAARAFAERVLGAAGDDEARLVSAFRLATSRRPDASEIEVLRGLLATERAAYAAAPERAGELIRTGASTPSPELDPVELAAWTHVTNLLLNLDEVVTKG